MQKYRKFSWPLLIRLVKEIIHSLSWKETIHWKTHSSIIKRYFENGNFLKIKFNQCYGYFITFHNWAVRVVYLKEIHILKLIDEFQKILSTSQNYKL